MATILPTPLFPVTIRKIWEFPSMLGCYNKVVDFVNQNLGAIFGGAVGLACFQLLGVILACCLGKYIDKAKYEPMG